MNKTLCPACIHLRIHTPEDWEAYHPYAKHGYLKEIGWTHEDLKPEVK